jgi:hypothetical protein
MAETRRAPACNPWEARHAPEPQRRNPRVPSPCGGMQPLSKTALTASAIKDYLDMEQRWLALAHSYDFAEGLSRFTEPVRRKKARENAGV